MKDDSHLLHADLTRSIIGGMYVVHSKLGFGFLEAVYKNALTVVLRHAGLRVEREVPYEMFLEGEPIGLYRADMIVESKILVEAKTGRILDLAHIKLVDNYLRASNTSVGLLLNFRPSAEFKRRVFMPDRAPGWTSESRGERLEH
jgi:GxxExxY protein